MARTLLWFRLKIRTRLCWEALGAFGTGATFTTLLSESSCVGYELAATPIYRQDSLVWLVPIMVKCCVMARRSETIIAVTKWYLPLVLQNSTGWPWDEILRLRGRLIHPTGNYMIGTMVAEGTPITLMTKPRRDVLLTNAPASHRFNKVDRLAGRLSVSATRLRLPSTGDRRPIQLES
jgi:hypothetical protein